MRVFIKVTSLTKSITMFGIIESCKNSQKIHIYTYVAFQGLTFDAKCIIINMNSNNICR